MVEGDAKVDVIRDFEDIDEKSNVVKANSTRMGVSMLRSMGKVQD